MRPERSHSIVKTIQRASRGLKLLLAVVTLLTSVISAYQTFNPLLLTWLGVGPSVSCRQPSEPFKLAISSDKYQYRVGENVSIYYYVNSNATLKIFIQKPDGTQVPVGTFLAGTAGTYRISLGSAWYPVGIRKLIAEAWSGNNVVQATSFYTVVEQCALDLAPSEYGAKKEPKAFYNASFQLLILDGDSSTPGENKEVTRFPGQSIGGSVSYRLWNTWNMSADQMWQVILVYSWAQSWPPTSEYQVLYSGSPGRFPVPTSSAHFNITAPSVPGTYYVWILACPSKTTARAISNLETPPDLPAHLRIVVKSRLRSTLSLNMSNSEAPWGSSVTVAGRIEPPLSGANIMLCYSRSQVADPLVLGYATTNAVGEFTHRWAPTSLGDYVIVATWSGSEENDPVTSALVQLTITFPWVNVVIISMLFSVGAVTILYLVRTAMRDRHPIAKRRRILQKTAGRTGRQQRKMGRRNGDE